MSARMHGRAWMALLAAAALAMPATAEPISTMSGPVYNFTFTGAIQNGVPTGTLTFGDVQVNNFNGAAGAAHNLQLPVLTFTGPAIHFSEPGVPDLSNINISLDPTRYDGQTFLRPVPAGGLAAGFDLYLPTTTLPDNAFTMNIGGTAGMTSNTTALDLNGFGPAPAQNPGDVALVLHSEDAMSFLDAVVAGATIHGSGQISFSGTPGHGGGSGQATPEPAAIAVWGLAGAMGLWHLRRYKRAVVVT